MIFPNIFLAKCGFLGIKGPSTFRLLQCYVAVWTHIIDAICRWFSAANGRAKCSLKVSHATKNCNFICRTLQLCLCSKLCQTLLHREIGHCKWCHKKWSGGSIASGILRSIYSENWRENRFARWYLELLRNDRVKKSLFPMNELDHWYVEFV